MQNCSNTTQVQSIHVFQLFDFLLKKMTIQAVFNVVWSVYIWSLFIALTSESQRNIKSIIVAEYNSLKRKV